MIYQITMQVGIIICSNINLVKQLDDNGSITHRQTFYPRLQNMANIQFSKTEETLLNLGGKYNMGYFT
jgi:hypothetical protein